MCPTKRGICQICTRNVTITGTGTNGTIDHQTIDRDTQVSLTLIQLV